jgi:serine protease Do
MPRLSSGSGVIIDPSGLILTNNHVVAGGGKLTVRLYDGRELEATDVKTDPNTDLAIVRVKASGSLPSASLGNSDQLRIGDWVLAVGQPFGLENTVTKGIVSATGRAVGITRYDEFIQTDAAINPGNSGGPLVNLRGEVVGINTAISSSSGGFQGVGFAIPVNVAKWVSSQLEKDGKVHRAYLGVGIQPIDHALATQLNLVTSHGALVTDVQPSSPAAKAGFQPQDVIVEFGGVKINSPRNLQAIAGRSAIGTSQPVTVLRDGKRVELHVTLREAPANYGERTTQPVENSPANDHHKKYDKLGLEVGPEWRRCSSTGRCRWKRRGHHRGRRRQPRRKGAAGPFDGHYSSGPQAGEGRGRVRSGIEKCLAGERRAALGAVGRGLAVCGCED